MEQGTSRGGADIQEIVKRLSLWGVNMLFVGKHASPESLTHLDLLHIPGET